MSQPDSTLLTMIIPVRDRETLVAKVLECVGRELALARFNVIVVDNGSVDSTRDVVSSWIARQPSTGSRLTLLEQPRPGACAARNLGVESAATPYVMFFDSDDIFHEGHVARIVERLTHSRPDLIVWDVEHSTLPGRHPLSTTPRKPTLKHHLYHASLATQRYCVRTDYLLKVGGWDESLPVWNDFELGVRLLLGNPKIEHLGGKPMVRVVPQAISITGTRWRDREAERIAALDKIERDLTGANRPDMISHVESRRVLLAATLRREGSLDTAAKLLAEVLRRSPSTKRMLFKLIYHIHSTFGRGGSSVAELTS